MMKGVEVGGGGEMLFYDHIFHPITKVIGQDIDWFAGVSIM
jgi:hypothetical protein